MTRWRRSMAIAQAGRRPRPRRCAARPASGPASRSPRLGWPCPTAASRSDEELLDAHRRRGQRQGGRRHRRRFGAGRTAGQAAPAEDRQAPRIGDPRGHGRGPGGRGRVPVGRVGDAGRGRRWRPTRSRSRRRPRPGTAVAHDDGLVVVLDTELTPGAARGGRRARAAARDPGPAPRGRPRARRPDRAVGRAAFPQPSRRTWPASPTDTLADLAAGDAPADAPTATVELAGGPVVIALRRRVADRTPA